MAEHPSLERAASAERNLVFGLLACMMDLIGRDELAEAMARWTSDKSRTLGEILVESQRLTDEERRRVEGLVDLHLARHEGDAQASLAAIGRLGPDCGALSRLDDSEVQSAITHVASAPLERDSTLPIKRLSSSIGLPTDAGSRFRIIRPHKRGGLGEVFIAEDLELKRTVALKQIQPERADDRGSRSRFLLEAEITGGLEHPGIVPVYGLGFDADDRPYYAMRFIRGESLKDAIQRFHGTAGEDHERPNVEEQSASARRNLEFHELLRRFMAVCNAVAYAHSRGVLHRDLKPANIMLGNFGETLVVDWGLAKPVDRVEDSLSAGEATVVRTSHCDAVSTVAGLPLGTPAFMSPEQAGGLGDELSPRTDVYGLGATLYCLLTGHPPFDGGNLDELLSRVRNGEFARPRDRNPTVPAPLEAICLKAMSGEADARYESPRALANDIELWLADEPVGAHQESRLQRAGRWARRHRALARAAAISLVALAAVSATAALVVNAARRDAERARIDESSARKTAETNLATARIRLAANWLSEGRRACEERDVGRGLLLMTRGLTELPLERTDLPEAAAMARAIQANVEAWSLRANRLVEILPHDGGVPALAVSRDGATLLTCGHDARARLWSALTFESIAPPLVHQGAVLGAAISPDGRTVATGSADGTARLWDAATGRPRCDPLVLQGAVRALAFDAEGRRLVAGSRGGSARIFDAQTGEPIGKELLHPEAVTAVAFSPDGRWIATGCEDDLARLWSAESQQLVEPPRTHDDDVYAVAFAPPGDRWLSAGRDGTARIWSLEDRLQPPVTIDHKYWILSAVFSSDGSKVVTASFDSTALISDAATGRPIGGVMQHAGPVMTAAFSMDGGLVATGGLERAARVWDAATGEQLGQPLTHRDIVLAVAFQPDSRTVFTAGLDDGVRVWRRLPGGQAAPPVRHGDLVTKTIFSEDGQRLFTASYDGTARFWTIPDLQPAGPTIQHGAAIWSAAVDWQRDLVAVGDAQGVARLYRATTGAAIGKPMTHQLPIQDVAISPNGARLATASQDGTARVWSAASGEPLGPSLRHDEEVSSVEFSPDGSTLLTAGGHQARLWDPATGRSLGEPLRHDHNVMLARFSPHGSRIATVSEDSTARLWDSETGAPIGSPLRHQGIVNKLAFSPDGKRLATAGQDGVVRVWNVQTAEPLGRTLPHRNNVAALAFSPDSNWLASGGFDKLIRLWDLETGEPIGPPLAHDGPLTTLEFSPDGRHLASGGQDRTVRLWRCPTFAGVQVERAVLATEVLTGMSIDASGEVTVLDPATWRERRSRLEQLERN